MKVSAKYRAQYEGNYAFGLQYHLTLLCCLLDLSNDFFFLILQGHALTVQLPDGFV